MEAVDQTAPTSDHESNSLMAEDAATPPTTKTADTKLDRLSIRPAENGGYIVDCSRSSVKPTKSNEISGYSSKDYVFETLDTLMAFLQQELA